MITRHDEGAKIHAHDATAKPLAESERDALDLPGYPGSQVHRLAKEALVRPLAPYPAISCITFRAITSRWISLVPS